jgi:MFS transporter, DHA2 family, multidrug resistance protein
LTPNIYLTQLFVSRGADLPIASDRALKTIENIVRRESFVLAFNDCFYFIGFALLLSGIGILFIKKVKPSAGGGGGH